MPEREQETEHARMEERRRARESERERERASEPASGHGKDYGKEKEHVRLRDCVRQQERIAGIHRHRENVARVVEDSASAHDTKIESMPVGASKRERERRGEREKQDRGSSMRERKHEREDTRECAKGMEGGACARERKREDTRECRSEREQERARESEREPERARESKRDQERARRGEHHVVRIPCNRKNLRGKNTLEVYIIL